MDSLLDSAFPPEDDLSRQAGSEGVSLTSLSGDSGTEGVSLTNLSRDSGIEGVSLTNLSRDAGIEGVSLKNLSRDSGLTTSDSQLYAVEEPENSFSPDGFVIEPITSKDNTVHAKIYKKFLSCYQIQDNIPDFVQGHSKPHTTDAQSGRKSSSEGNESSEFVYSSYFPGSNTTTKMPEGGVREEAKDMKPGVFPKETRVAEYNIVEITWSGNTKSGVRNARIVGTNVKPMKSDKIWTHKSELYCLYPECIPNKESFNNQIDSEYSHESHRSISPEYGGAAQYFRSPPENAEYFLGTNTLFERPVSAQRVGIRQVTLMQP